MQQVDLAGKLPVDLQGLGVEAGPVGVLETVPTELPEERGVVEKARGAGLGQP